MKLNLTKRQLKVFKANQRFKVLVSGRRFGKTFLAICEIMKYASKTNQKIWYVAPTYKQAKTICWADLKGLLTKFNWIEDVNESDLHITIKQTGSQIWLKGADNYDNLRGVGVDFLCLDEFADIPPKAWYEVLRASIADRIGNVLFLGTPRGFGNWAYELFLKEQTDKQWKSFKYTTLEGGIVTKDEIEQAKRDLDIRTFRQEYQASFEQYAGVIYYNFDPIENIKVKPKISKKYPIHIGLDFNIDPMSACVCQIIGNEIHFFEEIIIYSSNTDEIAKEISEKYRGWKIFVYPDPACRQRKTSAGGKTDLSILQNYGFICKLRGRHTQVRDRINAVNSKLKSANGIKYIFIDPTCKIMIKGLQRQLYKEGTNIPDKADGLDHMNDALGYLVDFLYPVKSEIKTENIGRWRILEHGI